MMFNDMEYFVSDRENPVVRVYARDEWSDDNPTFIGTIYKMGGGWHRPIKAEGDRVLADCRDMTSAVKEIRDSYR